MSNPPITYENIYSLGLQEFNPIFLNQLGENNLMARFDTKYPFHLSKLPIILEELSHYYDVLEIDGERNHLYESLYFDTEDLLLFRLHHNKKKNRYKFRFRRYCQSNTVFFEIKYKNNRSFTQKTRIPSDGFVRDLTPTLKSFVKENSNFDPDILKPSLRVFYKRITLVHKENKMRFTIDQAMHFSFKDQAMPLPNLAVAEVKRPSSKEDRFAALLFKKHKVYPLRLSKYCMGITSIYPAIKSNNYKQKMRMVNKIQEYDRVIG